LHEIDRFSPLIFVFQIEFETFSMFNGGVVDYHGEFEKISKISGL
jgi:hypothetical protein